MRRLLHPHVLVGTLGSYFTYQNITNLTSTSSKGQQIDIYEHPWQLMVRQQVPVCGSPVILSIAEVGSDDSEDDDEVLNKFREQVQQRV